MDSHQLELAADFCDLVGKPNLLEYLGLPESASPESLQKKLKARRKYMQGMQSNPKYRAEAIFLIKNFSSLNGVLANPIPYIEDARQRAESQHLPVLEMTIKSVLSGGSLNYDQEDYLRRNAVELGVSESTFEDVLNRLARGANIPRATEEITVSPEEMKTLDFYRMLGVPRHASRDEIYASYRAKTEEAKALPDPSQRDAERIRVEKAWKVLSDEHTRQQYDLSWSRTGPPARNRETSRPVQSSTAPPVQPRNAAPKPPPSAPFAGLSQTNTAPSLAPPKLELLSQTHQRLEVADAPITVSIEIRNSGELPLRGTISSNAPWLKVLNPALQPDLKQQAVRVQVDPTALVGRSSKGTVKVTSEDGQVASVEFDVHKSAKNVAMPMAIAGGVGALLFVGLAGFFMLGGDATYTINVDPWGQAVLIDGKLVGSGNKVVLDAVDGSEATVTVRHPNFRPWVKDVILDGGKSLAIQLRLDAKMDFKPAPGLKIGHLDPKVAVEVMAPFQIGMDRCLRSGVTGPDGVSGVVRIHVGQKGYPIGFDLESTSSAPSPAIRDCLKRQVAGPIFPALADGDYATIRYDYVLLGR